jgi:N-acetylglucosamine kinase-like BadF-type ATPase
MSLVAGLDGGRSKTAGMLADETGRVLARARGPGSAILGDPSDEACAVLSDMVAELCGQAGARREDVSAVGLALCGVDFADEFESQRNTLASALAAPQLVLANDAIVALWGAAPAYRLALVQHGSEATSACRARLGAERVFDSVDIAQLYDLRREAFALTARMIDGRAERTALADRILAHCGVTAAAFAEWAFRASEAPALRASSVAVVFAAWEAGDAAAAGMVRRAADDYALLIRAMAASLGEGAVAAAFGGGVISLGGARFAGALEAALARACPSASRVDIALPPEAGAVLMALHARGGDALAAFDRMAASAGD